MNDQDKRSDAAGNLWATGVLFGLSLVTFVGSVLLMAVADLKCGGLG